MRVHATGRQVGLASVGGEIKSAVRSAGFKFVQDKAKVRTGGARLWSPHDKTAGGVPLMDWIGYMLSGSEKWVSALDGAST